jgi:hypothetical protein
MFYLAISVVFYGDPFSHVELLHSLGWQMVATMILILGLTGILIGLFLLLRSRAMKVRYMRKEIPEWEKALKKWSKLFYCHSDLIVFDPANGEMINIENMDNLLFKP